MCYVPHLVVHISDTSNHAEYEADPIVGRVSEQEGSWP